MAKRAGPAAAATSRDAFEGPSVPVVYLLLTLDHVEMPGLTR